MRALLCTQATQVHRLKRQLIAATYTNYSSSIFSLTRCLFIIHDVTYINIISRRVLSPVELENLDFFLNLSQLQEKMHTFLRASNGPTPTLSNNLHIPSYIYLNLPVSPLIYTSTTLYTLYTLYTLIHFQKF